MTNSESVCDLQNFYPANFFKFEKVENSDNEISIFLKSITHSCKCEKCGSETVRYHGTYMRKIQDLPMLGRTTSLYITAHEYRCSNDQCEVKTVAETYDGFLGHYGRYTERCEDFIETLALETSGEGAARVCRKMGINISGDTILRIIKKRFEKITIEKTEDVIGIDDFSTKKGLKYCTIVCNESTHTPIAVLDGRDGESFRDWIKKNKHVKTVTRDRASSYAKVISEELPDAMQVADRFHLHQNLLEVVKKALSSDIPKNVKINVAGTNEIVKEQLGIEDDNKNDSDEKISCKKNATHCG